MWKINVVGVFFHSVVVIRFKNYFFCSLSICLFYNQKHHKNIDHSTMHSKIIFHFVVHNVIKCDISSSSSSSSNDSNNKIKPKNQGKNFVCCFFLFDFDNYLKDSGIVCQCVYTKLEQLFSIRSWIFIHRMKKRWSNSCNRKSQYLLFFFFVKWKAK